MEDIRAKLLLKKQYHLEAILNHSSLEEAKEAIKLLKERIDLLSNPDYPKYLETRIEDLNLTGKAKNPLLGYGLLTIGDITSFGIENLWKLRGIGEKSIVEITHAVEQKVSELKNRHDNSSNGI